MTPDSELEEIKARYAIHMAEEAQRKLKKAAQQIERITAIAANRVNCYFDWMLGIVAIPNSGANEPCSYH